MSILSNHFPDLLDEMNRTACTCPPEGHGVDEMCDACQSDYEQWASRFDAERAAWEGIVEILPEPCGQQSPEEPLFDPPF